MGAWEGGKEGGREGRGGDVPVLARALASAVSRFEILRRRCSTCKYIKKETRGIYARILRRRDEGYRGREGGREGAVAGGRGD